MHSEFLWLQSFVKQVGANVVSSSQFTSLRANLFRAHSFPSERRWSGLWFQKLYRLVVESIWPPYPNMWYVIRIVGLQLVPIENAVGWGNLKCSITSETLLWILWWFQLVFTASRGFKIFTQTYGFYVPVNKMNSHQYWASARPGSLWPQTPKKREKNIFFSDLLF